MMDNTREFRYAFSANGTYPRRDHFMHVGERDYQSSLRRIRDAVYPAQITPVWADDLLRIARAVYLVDKRSVRPAGCDPWTRKLRLWVQVTEPDRWQGKPLTSLTSLLRTLTSDVWEITLDGGATPIDAQYRLYTDSTASEITLFSGGLDSTAHAAQRACNSGGTLMLLGHDLAGAGAPQKRIRNEIDQMNRKQRTVTYYQVGDIPLRAGNRPLESSTRSRGFLFAVTALYAAAAHGIPHATIPENGQLAINPPLTEGRLAACSTRSVHPSVLQQLNQLIAEIGGTVSVVNPFLYKTKGEVCTVARDSGLSAAALASSVSCGNHPTQRLDGNCGYCFPCLVRRSGLHAALGTDPTPYGSELVDLAGPDTLEHLRDLQQWLVHAFTTADLIADKPLPNDVNLQSLMAMLCRGRRELTNMFSANLQ